MIRDVTFNDHWALTVSTDWPYTAQFLLAVDVDNDGEDEILLCDRLGNIKICKVW